VAERFLKSAYIRKFGSSKELEYQPETWKKLSARKEATVRLIGVKIHATRPPFPMSASKRYQGVIIRQYVRSD
jgi:hypothetical protein